MIKFLPKDFIQRALQFRINTESLSRGHNLCLEGTVVERTSFASPEHDPARPCMIIWAESQGYHRGLLAHMS